MSVSVYEATFERTDRIPAAQGLLRYTPVKQVRQTIAIDLDGCLADIRTEKGGAIGPPRLEAVPVLERLKENGWQIIVYTVRPDEWLVKNWCEIYFPGLIDAINVNPEDVAETGICAAKPHADVYIDDKAWPLLRPPDWGEIEEDFEKRGWLTCYVRS